MDYSEGKEATMLDEGRARVNNTVDSRGSFCVEVEFLEGYKLCHEIESPY